MIYKLTNYQINAIKNEFNVTDDELDNFQDCWINPYVLYEMNNYYELNMQNDLDVTINKQILYKYNPVMYKFSYKYNNKKLIGASIYNPYTLEYSVNNPNECEYHNMLYYSILTSYSINYDYITSKKFYDKIIEYKNKHPECDDIWNMWLNINPYSEQLLLNNDELVYFDFLSLNPNCFEIYNKLIDLDDDDDEFMYDYPYLNEFFLSANPAIVSYNYFNISYKNQNLKTDLIKEMYKPERIAKFLESNENIEEYLN